MCLRSSFSLFPLSPTQRPCDITKGRGFLQKGVERGRAREGEKEREKVMCSEAEKRERERESKRAEEGEMTEGG